ncbi:hypothetical protein DYB25_000534 [Aphanomyces astaci]|uniref:Uncharacterized protein n=1 Tax=Aphanomyces astaci TaxID=112090 RepID=A0A397AR50_APHAT|nr:hypothetical protein DYB36_001155 [Aphanomyces astaci]RHY16494.1 hypothetical protein DYB25_000534 [Aphanomyces astaci]
MWAMRALLNHLEGHNPDLFHAVGAHLNFHLSSALFAMTTQQQPSPLLKLHAAALLGAMMRSTLHPVAPKFWCHQLLAQQVPEDLLRSTTAHDALLHLARITRDGSNANGTDARNSPSRSSDMAIQIHVSSAVHALADVLQTELHTTVETPMAKNDDAAAGRAFVTHGGLNLVAVTAIKSSSKAIKSQCARVIANLAVHHRNIHRQLEDVLGGALFSQELLHWAEEPNVVVRSSTWRTDMGVSGTDVDMLERSTMWPEAFLMRDLHPDSRLVTMGYDAGMSKWSSPWRALTLDERAQVKEVLWRAEVDGQELARRTAGVVFMAVPHLGANLAKLNNDALRKLIQAHPATKDLNANNARLTALNAAFERLHIPSLSLGEGAPAPLGLGVNHLIVKPESADPHIHLSTFHEIPHAHHMDICKPPTPTDPRYTLVREFIATHVPPSQRHDDDKTGEVEV